MNDLLGFKFKTFGFLILLVIAFPTAATAGPNHARAQTQAKQNIGWLEQVRVYPSAMLLTAKMDTGAKHSSIKAEVLEMRKIDGVLWVYFTIMNKKDKTIELKLPVLRTAKIRGRGGILLERPVVKMGICLGNHYKIVEVNLSPRIDFNYHIIIGRSFLQDTFTVDVAQTFTARPSCKETPAP